MTQPWVKYCASVPIAVTMLSFDVPVRTSVPFIEAVARLENAENVASRSWESTVVDCSAGEPMSKSPPISV